MGAIVLINARLIDGTGAEPVEQATLVIEDGRIAEVRGGESGGAAIEGTETIDLEGRTLLPGLINAHMHLLMDAGPDPLHTLSRMEPAEAALLGALTGARMLRAGITAARDLGGYEYVELALRAAFARGDFPGPRLLCAGKIITMTGGHGWPLGFEADGPDEVRSAARRNLKRGVDCIKLMATGGVLTPGVEPGAQQLAEAEMRAAIEEAHHVGKHTATHAQGTEGVKNAIRAGIDTIEHGIFLDAEAIELMVERDLVFVPTLAAPYQIVEAGEARGVPAYAVEKSKRVIDAHRRSFEQALAAGVIIAAGNDGGTPFNPSEDLVTELSLMIEYGMSPLVALKAATFNSAKALGLSGETGTLQQGKWADCLVLDKGADPLRDIGDLSKVWMVIKQGKLV
ncbi:MAG: amidohydrolase family protein [Chloroflexia bacterium]